MCDECGGIMVKEGNLMKCEDCGHTAASYDVGSEDGSEDDLG